MACAASGCKFLATTDYYTGHRSPRIFGRAKTMASAEAWGAALLMAQTWVLASVVA